MKKTIFILAITIGIFTTAQTANLTVNMNGFDNSKGQVMVGLYDAKSNFLKKIYKGEVVKISNKTAKVTFKNIPTGKEYAVSIFHDENSNQELDSNFFGIPTEDYGCSNGAKGFMGPPKWKDAKFKFTSNKTINIKV